MRDYEYLRRLAKASLEEKKWMPLPPDTLNRTLKDVLGNTVGEYCPMTKTIKPIMGPTLHVDAIGNIKNPWGDTIGAIGPAGTVEPPPRLPVPPPHFP